MEVVTIDIADIDFNEGQIPDVPKNPRRIGDWAFKKLIKSIEEFPEFMEARELIVYPFEGRYVCLCGNMRLRAVKEVGWKAIKCKVVPSGTNVKDLRAYIIKDNIEFGEYDEAILNNDWDSVEVKEWSSVDAQEDEGESFNYQEDVENELSEEVQGMNEIQQCMCPYCAHEFEIEKRNG